MAPSTVKSTTKKVTNALKKVGSSIKKKASSSTTKKSTTVPSKLSSTLNSDDDSISNSQAGEVVSNNALNATDNTDSTSNTNNASTVSMTSATMFGMGSFSADMAATPAGIPSTGQYLVLNAPGIVLPTRPAIIKSAEVPMPFAEYHVNEQGCSFFLAPISTQQGSSSVASSSNMSPPSPLVMPAANGRSFGKDASRRTVGHPLQDVSLKNLHPLLFQLESGHKKSFAETEVPDLKDANGDVIRNANGNKLRDILGLPRYIGRNFEAGLYLELFRRLDSRFEVTDVFDRMDVDVFETGKRDPVAKSIKNSWSNQRGRLRGKINAKAWNKAREMPTKAELEIIEHLEVAQIVANTSMVIEDGKLWQPRHHAGGRVDYVDSGLALDHFKRDRPTSNPSKRMQSAAALRCRLQTVAKADGKGNESKSWEQLDKEDEPYWWYDRNPKKAKDRGNGDVAANRAPGGPKYAEVVKGSERRVSQIDNKTHSEWMLERMTSFTEDDIDLPKEPRSNRLVGGPRHPVNDEEDNCDDNGDLFEDGAAVVNELATGNKRGRVDDDEEDAEPTNVDSGRVMAATKRRKTAPPYPSAAARKSISALNAAVAATASDVEREEKILAWARKTKPVRKPRKSRAKPKSTDNMLAVAQQSLPSYAMVSDTLIDPRLLSTEASAANSTVSDADGAVAAHTDNAQSGLDRGNPLDEPATVGDVVNGKMTSHTQTYAGIPHNGHFAEMPSSTPDIETTAPDVLDSSSISQSGETHLSSLPTMSYESSDGNTPSDQSIDTPSAQQTLTLPSSVMDPNLMFAGHGPMLSDDWDPENEFLGSSNGFSF